jgi:hypothetical protein
MQSTVKFVDEASGVERTLQLVYPQAADIEAERISILSLVGAGLLRFANRAIDHVAGPRWQAAALANRRCGARIASRQAPLAQHWRGQMSGFALQFPVLRAGPAR